MFDFLKKRSEGVPDLGHDGESSSDNYANDFDNPLSEEPTVIKNNKKFSSKKNNESRKKLNEEDALTEENIDSKVRVKKINNSDSVALSLDLKKATSRIEILNEIVKGYSERFSRLSEQIGEVRTMAITNEKEIARATIEGERAVDIVKEVQPDRLRMDLQKQDMKIMGALEKITANSQYMEAVMNELKELRRKDKVFVGTDALIKLNEDVKNDLIDIQKLSSRVKISADKSEQIFIELKNGFAENQKTKETIAALENNSLGVQTKIDKLRLDANSLVSQSYFDEFKKTINGKFAVIEQLSIEMEKTKEENNHISKIIEDVATVAKNNSEELSRISISLKEKNIPRVNDCGDQLNSILNIIDTLVEDNLLIKKKIGASEIKTKGGDSPKLEWNDIVVEAKSVWRYYKERGVEDSKIIELFHQRGWTDEDLRRVVY